MNKKNILFWGEVLHSSLQQNNPQFANYDLPFNVAFCVCPSSLSGISAHVGTGMLKPSGLNCMSNSMLPVCSHKIQIIRKLRRIVTQMKLMLSTIILKKNTCVCVKLSKSYRWLKRLRETPNSMWMTPRITDIFILNEFRKVSLLVATFQICKDNTVWLIVYLIPNTCLSLLSCLHV